MTSSQQTTFQNQQGPMAATSRTVSEIRRMMEKQLRPSSPFVLTVEQARQREKCMSDLRMVATQLGLNEVVLATAQTYFDLCIENGLELPDFKNSLFGSLVISTKFHEPSQACPRICPLIEIITKYLKGEKSIGQLEKGVAKRIDWRLDLQTQVHFLLVLLPLAGNSFDKNFCYKVALEFFKDPLHYQFTPLQQAAASICIARRRAGELPVWPHELASITGLSIKDIDVCATKIAAQMNIEFNQFPLHNPDVDRRSSENDAKRGNSRGSQKRVTNELSRATMVAGSQLKISSRQNIETKSSQTAVTTPKPTVAKPSEVRRISQLYFQEKTVETEIVNPSAKISFNFPWESFLGKRSLSGFLDKRETNTIEQESKQSDISMLRVMKITQNKQQIVLHR